MFSRMIKWLLMLAAAILAVLYTNCDVAANPENDHSKSDKCDIVDYGGGVFYFPCTADIFGRTLAKFTKTQTPKCAVTAMAGDGSRGHGRDKGYFIVLTCDTSYLSK